MKMAKHRGAGENTVDGKTPFTEKKQPQKSANTRKWATTLRASAESA